MNQIVVLKNAAYLAGENGVITNPNEISTLSPGAYGFVLDGLVLYDGTNAAARERVQLMVGLSTRTSSREKVQACVPIHRRSVLSINYEAYKEPVTKQVEIGPFSFTDINGNQLEGDVGMTISDSSYIGTIQSNQIRLSTYRTKNKTLVEVIDKFVANINNGVGIAGTSFCTAQKIGTSDATYKIRLTMKSEHVILSVALNGLFALAPVVTTREAVISLGKGEDVVRTEKDFNSNLGDGGYYGMNEAFFSKPLEANASEKYDIIQIKFQGVHDLPQNKVNAAVNHLMIAIPSTATTVVTGLLQRLDDLFGGAFTEDIGTIVVSEDDPDETDGENPGA